MKICHIVCVTKPYLSGIGNAAWRLAQGSAQRGHQVCILSPRYDQGLPREETVDKIKIKRLKPLISYGNAAILPQLFSEIREHDIIHLHFPFYGSHELVWLAKMMPASAMRLVLHYHMNPSDLPLKLKPFLLPTNLIFNSLMNEAEIVICSSFDYLQNNINQHLYANILPKARELPFGIDIDEFKPGVVASVDKRLLFVGALDSAHNFKGLEILLQALALIDKDITLRIIGTGDREDYYRELADKLNLRGRVIFSGKINNRELIAAYQDSSLLVLPSINRHEAFGIVLIEAMACGLPVIASNLSGVRTVFTNGQEGFYIKPGDYLDLKTKIERYFENTEISRRFSQSARQLAAKKYSQKVVDDTLEAIYQSLL